MNHFKKLISAEQRPFADDLAKKFEAFCGAIQAAKKVKLPMKITGLDRDESTKIDYGDGITGSEVAIYMDFREKPNG